MVLMVPASKHNPGACNLAKAAKATLCLSFKGRAGLSGLKPSSKTKQRFQTGNLKCLYSVPKALWIYTLGTTHCMYVCMYACMHVRMRKVCMPDNVHESFVRFQQKDNSLERLMQLHHRAPLQKVRSSQPIVNPKAFKSAISKPEPCTAPPLPPQLLKPSCIYTRRFKNELTASQGSQRRSARAVPARM